MIGVAAARTVRQGLPAATRHTACGSVSCGRPTEGDHRKAARPDIMRRGVFWRGRTRAELLASSLAPHNHQHLGEALAIKSLLALQAPATA